MNVLKQPWWQSFLMDELFVWMIIFRSKNIGQNESFFPRKTSLQESPKAKRNHALVCILLFLDKNDWNEQLSHINMDGLNSQTWGNSVLFQGLQLAQGLQSPSLFHSTRLSLQIPLYIPEKYDCMLPHSSTIETKNREKIIKDNFGDTYKQYLTPHEADSLHLKNCEAGKKMANF